MIKGVNKNDKIKTLESAYLSEADLIADIHIRAGTQDVAL